MSDASLCSIKAFLPNLTGDFPPIWISHQKRNAHDDQGGKKEKEEEDPIDRRSFEFLEDEQFG